MMLINFDLLTVTLIEELSISYKHQRSQTFFYPYYGLA